MVFLTSLGGTLAQGGKFADFEVPILPTDEVQPQIVYVSGTAIGDGSTVDAPMLITTALAAIGTTIDTFCELRLVPGIHRPASLVDGWSIPTSGTSNTYRVILTSADDTNRGIVRMSLSQFEGGSPGTPLTSWTLMTVLAFANGTAAPSLGSTTTGVTSGATGTVRKVVLVSGSWGGGTAAGWLILQPGSGTFGTESVGYANITAQGANTTVYRSTSTVQAVSGSMRSVGGHIPLGGDWYPLVHVRADDTSIWQTNERYNNLADSRWYTGPMVMGDSDQGHVWIRLNDPDPVEMVGKPTVSTGTTDPNQHDLRLYFNDSTAFVTTVAENIMLDGIDFEDVYMAFRSQAALDNLTIRNTVSRVGYYLSRLGDGDNLLVEDNVCDGHLGKPEHWLSWIDVKGGYTQAELVRKCFLQTEGSNIVVRRNSFHGFFDGILSGVCDTIDVYDNDSFILDDMFQTYVTNINVSIYRNDCLGAGPSPDGAGTGTGTDPNHQWFDNIFDPSRRPFFLGRKNSMVSGAPEGIGTAPCISSHGADTDLDAYLLFGSNPANNDTVTIAGTVVTFKSAAPGANEVLIGATAADSRTALVTWVNANLAGVKAYSDAFGATPAAFFYDAAPPIASTITVASGTAAITTTAATTTNYRFPRKIMSNSFFFPADSLVTSFLNLTMFNATAWNENGQHLLLKNLIFVETAFMPLARDVLPQFDDQIIDWQRIYRTSVGSGAGAHYRQVKGSGGYNTTGAATVAAWQASSGFTDSQVHYAPGWDANTTEVVAASKAVVVDADYKPLIAGAQTGAPDLTSYALHSEYDPTKPYFGAVAP